jgi:hypothetical protein
VKDKEHKTDVERNVQQLPERFCTMGDDTRSLEKYRNTCQPGSYSWQYRLVIAVQKCIQAIIPLEWRAFMIMSHSKEIDALLQKLFTLICFIRMRYL